MGRNPQLCKPCTHNCRFFHFYTTTTTSPTSFYKLILRQNDFKILYLPHKFNRSMSTLVDKKINLTDAMGQRWVVKVSKIGGSFALKEGWDVFSLNHGLEIGYIVVFNCFDKLDFDVKIYDISVCEKLDFSKQRNRKKTRRCSQDPTASLVVVPQHVEVDVGGTQNIIEIDNEDGGVQSTRKSEHTPDPCYIPSHKYQNDAAFFNKDPMFEEVLGTGDVSYASKLEWFGSNNSFGESSKSAYDMTSALMHEENIGHKYIMSNREVQECQFTESLGSDQAPKSEEKFNEISDGLDVLIPIGEINEVPMNMSPKMCSFNDKLNVTEVIEGELPEVIVGELPEVGLPEVIEGELPEVIEREHNEEETAATITCEVVTNNNYLKLPKCLPLPRGRRLQMKRTVVLLRDSLKRLWPVLYFDVGETWLTSGWLSFQRANNIKSGDVCVFQPGVEIEKESKGIVNVHLVHN